MSKDYYSVAVFDDIVSLSNQKPIRVLTGDAIVRFHVDKHNHFDVSVKDGVLSIHGEGQMEIRPRMSNDIEIRKCSS